MKNPKLGERVAFNTHSDGRKTGTITKIYGDEHVSITPDVKSGTTWLYLARPNELRRLVPKKRERTYTEAEVKLAFNRSLGSLCWLNFLTHLREGSGK